MRRMLLAATALVFAGCASAIADPLSDIGAMCLQGNTNACVIYQTAQQAETQREWQLQAAGNAFAGYMLSQGALANQRMAAPQVLPPVNCWNYAGHIVCN